MDLGIRGIYWNRFDQQACWHVSTYPGPPRVSNFTPQVCFGGILVAQISKRMMQVLKIARFSGFASGAGPVLADDGKQNPEAAEEMMVAKIRYECGVGGWFTSGRDEKNTRAGYDSLRF